jgi:hypothetical protein
MPVLKAKSRAGSQLSLISLPAVGPDYHPLRCDCRAREPAAILAAGACQQFAALLWSTGNLGQGGGSGPALPARRGPNINVRGRLSGTGSLGQGG